MGGFINDLLVSWVGRMDEWINGGLGGWIDR